MNTMKSYLKEAINIRIICLVSFILLSTTLVAATEERNTPFAKLSPEVQSKLRPICEAVKDQDFPVEDRPSTEMARSLTNVDSEKLYYGIGTKVDPIKARLRAFTELNEELKNKEHFGFHGASMLMTIYANGKGAKRNLDLALKIACNYDVAQADSQAEIEGRIEHLSKLKKENWQGDDFSICDDITSGYMCGVCTAHEARIAEAERDEKFSGITKSWGEEDKINFQALLDSAEAFFESRSIEEVEQSGTARAALMIEEKERLTNDFLSSVINFEKEKYFKFKEAEFQKADENLNDIYKKVLNTYKVIEEKNESLITIKPNGIKQTERLWLKYREAWVFFAQKKYPNVSSVNIRTWLTKKRIEMLEKLYSEGKPFADKK